MLGILMHACHRDKHCEIGEYLKYMKNPVYDLVVTCDAIEDTLESGIINGCNGIDYWLIASCCFISNQVFIMAGGHDYFMKSGLTISGLLSY